MNARCGIDASRENPGPSCSRLFMHRKSVYLLVICVAAMLVLGIVMLFSTSAFAQDSHGDPVYFVKRQAMWLGIGIIGCIVTAMIDYHWWQKTWLIWFALACVLLALCFVPPIGMKINGSWRWINLRFLSFQPSELAKLATVVFLAHWFAKYAAQSGEFWRGFVAPFAAVAVMMALIAAEVDLGSTALIGGTMFLMMFIAGTNLYLLGPLTVAGVVGILVAAMQLTERHGRLMAFIDPEKFKNAAGLQQWQALIAFGYGGVEGLGLGNGRQKMLYVPFAHTDFILPMIGEELGLRASLGIVFCYLVIMLCGIVIAVQSRDRFGLLLGAGLVIIIALQAAVNIGVTTSLLPNKGLPLPFISYGGSNLLFCLLSVGILINIWRQGLGEKSDRALVRLNAKFTPRI